MNGSNTFLFMSKNYWNISYTSVYSNREFLCFHKDLDSKTTITTCAQLQRHKGTSMERNKGKCKGHLFSISAMKSCPPEVISHYSTLGASVLGPFKTYPCDLTGKAAAELIL